MLDAKTNPKGMGKNMKYNFKAPYRVGGHNKTLTSNFIVNNAEHISDLMWQGIKFIMTELKSDAPYGDGSPTNLALRKCHLTATLEKGFYNFYRIVGYCDKEAQTLTANAMKIWNSHTNDSISNINTILLIENMFLAQGTISLANKRTNDK